MATTLIGKITVCICDLCKRNHQIQNQNEIRIQLLIKQLCITMPFYYLNYFYGETFNKIIVDKSKLC